MTVKQSWETLLTISSEGNLKQLRFLDFTVVTFRMILFDLT